MTNSKMTMQEEPTDTEESYLERGGGPQSRVELGAGEEHLLTRFQTVLEENIAGCHRLAPKAMLFLALHFDRDAFLWFYGLLIGGMTLVFAVLAKLLHKVPDALINSRSRRPIKRLIPALTA